MSDSQGSGVKVKKEELLALSDKSLMGTYRRFPIILVKGSGVKLWDSDGREYLDFVAGIAVCNLGHSHPKVVEAIKKQVEILTHTSNLYYTEPQIHFARFLVENSFADKVFFCNSGAEFLSKKDIRVDPLTCPGCFGRMISFIEDGKSSKPS